MNIAQRSGRFAAMLFLLVCGGIAAPALGEQFIVEDGEANAEIVVAESPRRTALLAAQELQAYIEKISGAKLPIVTEPTGNAAVTVFVGRSPHTERRGITGEALKDGAYRIVSGEDWLVLIGDDEDFTPVEPWPKSSTHWRSGEVHEQWDRITGAKWGNPMSGLYKKYMGNAGAFGGPLEMDKPADVWAYDEAGSFNAVCGFLRRLGVRWYMPGDIGEVVPSLPSIALPDIEETVRPDFSLRRFCFSYRVQGRDVALWAMRLGVRDPYGLEVAHGISTITSRTEMMEAHPEYYALYGGKRNNDPESRYNHVCLSSQGLFEETVAYARAVFDHYGRDVVSIMPEDAFTAMCQCELCEGKDTPERGSRGRLSDYVWDFVNRVAEETAKTHPDKMIGCLAYGSYTLPPLKIDRLHPNVQVGIVGGRRPTAVAPERRAQIRALREGWIEKTPNKIYIFENYPFTNRGYYLPSYTAHTNAESINATKGASLGEDIWLSIINTFHEPGYNHFPVYFTARMYWGGKDQDIDAMLEEYYRLFYGPAEKEMKAFFEYCEANWTRVRDEQEVFDRTFDLFDAARERAGEDTVYGKRIDVVGDYLSKLREMGVKVEIELQRVGVPEVRLAEAPEGIEIDGKLDEPFWQAISESASGALKRLPDGGEAEYATTFKAAWRNENLYLAIRCEDQPGEELNIATDRNEDPAIWYGDVIEILIETDQHSYYQIAISPAGALVDLDRAFGTQTFQWNSQAEVAAQRGDGYWTIEARFPVTDDPNDPYHQIVGSRPVKSQPWHFNVCRQRLRGNERQLSAFSPTGESFFHVLAKFAKMYCE